MKRFLFTAALLLPVPALALECPPGAKACKVMTLTPEEQQILLNPNGIFDTAERARFLDLTNYVKYFREKIATSPDGDVKAPVASPPNAEEPKPVTPPNPNSHEKERPEKPQ